MKSKVLSVILITLLLLSTFTLTASAAYTVDNETSESGCGNSCSSTSGDCSGSCGSTSSCGGSCGSLESSCSGGCSHEGPCAYDEYGNMTCCGSNNTASSCCGSTTTSSCGSCGSITQSSYSLPFALEGHVEGDVVTVEYTDVHDYYASTWDEETQTVRLLDKDGSFIYVPAHKVVVGYQLPGFTAKTRIVLDSEVGSNITASNGIMTMGKYKCPGSCTMNVSSPGSTCGGGCTGSSVDCGCHTEPVVSCGCGWNCSCKGSSSTTTYYGACRVTYYTSCNGGCGTSGTTISCTAGYCGTVHGAASTGGCSCSSYGACAPSSGGGGSSSSGGGGSSSNKCPGSCGCDGYSCRMDSCPCPDTRTHPCYGGCGYSDRDYCSSSSCGSTGCSCCHVHSWSFTGYSQYNSSYHYANYHCYSCGESKSDLESHSYSNYGNAISDGSGGHLS